MAKKILVLNTGSTSTKVALYLDTLPAREAEYRHPGEELAGFASMADQIPMRTEHMRAFIAGLPAESRPFDAIVARGGMLPPIQAGGYAINDNMCEFLEKYATEEHASNIAAPIAHAIAQEYAIPNAYIYDGVSTDELTEISRLSGLPQLPRVAINHVLNAKAIARRHAADMGKSYAEVTLIVAHLGGGISVGLHKNGRMVDIVRDDEGTFSPERAGRIQVTELFRYLQAHPIPTLREQMRFIRGTAGLKALLGTGDALEVEKRIEADDEKAKLAYRAMAYQVAKSIGEMAAAASGRVEGIVLTGGIARSQMLTGWIAEQVGFIAPVTVIPGENEMESLAGGALRILNGEEEARVFNYQELLHQRDERNAMFQTQARK